MRHSNYLFILLLILLLNCRVSAPMEVVEWESRAEKVEIIRDDFGIPHIYAKSDADAVFGMLYAQCEDDFRRVERNYIWATGRLAQLEGEKAIYSDVRAQLYMTDSEAIAAYNSAPEWLKELCKAFADGINYYLHTHPEVEPYVITRYEPWFPMYFSEGSIGGDIEQIPLNKIKSFYEEDQTAILTETNEEKDIKDDEPRGSNGVALSGALTSSGNTILLINPHTTFYFRPEVHVVSEEGLNAYGAVTWGQFFIYQGFNEKTGWMHTSTQVDFIDEFIEEIHSKDGKLQYRYGNEMRDVETIPVNIKYKDGEDVKERHFNLYRTHHGPVTHTIDGKWVATKINWDPVNALIQSYTRTKTKNYEEFREMMNIRSNSSNNTVFADAEGNIAYFHGNFIPRRNPEFDFSKPVDGSDPTTDWQGLHTVDECITIVNPDNGWIQNCNSTPFTASGVHSPAKENFPVYMGPDSENFRGINAVRLLENASEMDIDKMIQLAYDPHVLAFEKIIPPLISAYDRTGSKRSEIQEAIEVFKSWNFQSGEESIAMTIAHFYGMAFVSKYGILNQLTGADVKTLFTSPGEQKELLALFEEVLDGIKEDFGSWNVAWGDINRFQRLSGDIDLQYDDEKESLPVGFASGRWGSLASFGASAKTGTKKLYGNSGNSFIAVVEFGDTLKAKSILAGGQNSNPESPHFFDQAQRYTNVQFKDVAFYRQDVESRARETYQPGKR